ncbi:uncharacterized protein B0H18DRAFT_1044583 [Fomitopsis serialis]|uniref:uncharacterized protein n=1 Tax=Fomitopsis serialis TaxID=139415 RepID=UPI0020085DCF|nr:uncharacterized protein B0H18DRAFT_1044583 [Neoantrodia serialis]KAH9914598.1 hypothetical protein B0H18DRAFT_1044583 [Neoantrodia serialis]
MKQWHDGMGPATLRFERIFGTRICAAISLTPVSRFYQVRSGLHGPCFIIFLLSEIRLCRNGWDTTRYSNIANPAARFSDAQLGDWFRLIFRACENGKWDIYIDRAPLLRRHRTVHEYEKLAVQEAWEQPYRGQVQEGLRMRVRSEDGVKYTCLRSS